MRDAMAINRERVRNWSIGGLCAVIALFFPINKAYVDWHTALTRTVVQEEVSSIKNSIETTQETADATANKVDFLVKAEAARLVDGLKTQLAVLRSQSDPGILIQRDIAELEKRIESAITYRDCVINERPNCDALRVF